MAPGPASSIRCGDTDREKVVAALRDHYAEGRLTLEEFDQRSDAAYAARTFADLQPLMADLPPAPLQQPPVREPAPAKPAKPSTGPHFRIAPWMVIVAVCVFVSVVGTHGFWPFWLLIPTFIVLTGGLRHRRGRSYGPEGQLRDEARDLRIEQQRLRIQERRARIERQRQRLDRRMR
jgi:hypothetical protein